MAVDENHKSEVRGSSSRITYTLQLEMRLFELRSRIDLSSKEFAPKVIIRDYTPQTDFCFGCLSYTHLPMVPSLRSNPQMV